MKPLRYLLILFFALTCSAHALTDIWVAARTDNIAGTGTEVDPFDGSTAAKFDAVLFSYYDTVDVDVHLVGAGPFLTSINHAWLIRPGWIIEGDGMLVTTIRATAGSLAGLTQACCVQSNSNISTDNVIIRDLTIDANWDGLSATADTGTGGEKNMALSALTIWGNNNLVQRVRSINTYGSWANQHEHFAISLISPTAADGTNDVIDSCLAELPKGNYGNPFHLAGGGASYVLANAMVISSVAVGVNNGLSTGFTSGGVNLFNVKDCWVDSNTFTDCFGAAYIDTGSVDGLHVLNNKVTRGWAGVAISTHGTPRQNIEIAGNTFSIQNRVASNYGIIFDDNGTTASVTIENNTITFDSSGLGTPGTFTGIAGYLLSTATIRDNVIGLATGLVNITSGSGITLCNNRTTQGALISTLSSPLSYTAFSRRVHGSAGTFNISIPTTGSLKAVEPRTGNAQQIAFVFPQAVTVASAEVICGAGSVASISGSGSTEILVNLTGVITAQTMCVVLHDVHYGSTTANVCAQLGVLFGDTSGNGVVSSTDVSLVKAQVAAPVTASNFRKDVNANGVISTTDVSAAKSQVGQVVP